jgi:DNA repair exonuclease SbcCD ATPase subunit
MKKQAIKSVASFAVVLMVLSIIPSGALASENGTSSNQSNSTDYGFGKMVPGGMRHGGAGPDEMHGMGFCPAEKITEENFTVIQAGILDSITEKISELQNMYSNVSEASTAEELKEVLLAERQANAEDMGPCEKGGFPGKMCVPCLFEVENVTDDNFTEVQTEIVDSIGNMTDMLNGQLENTTDENMTSMLNEQITELEELSADVSEASSAAELQEVILTYMKTQAVDPIEKEIEHIEARVSESENSTDDTDENVTELNDKITELTALIEDINAAESFDDLKEIMSSEMKSEKGPMLEGRTSMQKGKGPMQQQGNCGRMPGCPGFQQKNNTEV